MQGIAEIETVLPLLDKDVAALFASARDNANFTFTDFCTINDLLDRSGYRGSASTAVLLLCLFLALEEGSLCVQASARGLARRLQDLLDEAQANAWASRIVAECTRDQLPGLIGRGPDDNRPVVLYQVGARRFYYFQRFLRHEIIFRAQLEKRLTAPRCTPGVDIENTPRTLDEQSSISLDARQRSAVALALERNLTIISGGPGTGKTSIVVSLLRALARSGASPERIALAAPTGRAAQRLTDAIRQGLASLPADCPLVEQQLRQVEAHTLHHLLRYSPSRGIFLCHAECPVPADAIIIDEVSMVGIGLMSQLLQATRPDTRLVLLGDKDQLPSVDAGAVLANLLQQESRSLLADCVVLLETNYRSEQHIRTAAAAINEQRLEIVDELPRLEVADLQNAESHGCAFLPIPDAGVRPLLRAWAERHYLTAYKEIVLSPLPRSSAGGGANHIDELFRHLNRARLLTVLKEGPYGSNAINEFFDEMLRPQFDGSSRGRFFAGAPVLITRNDHARRLFNGDVGVILKTPNGSYQAVFVRHQGYEAFPAESLPSHELGFALTVHKSQGSEYDEVLLVLPASGGRRLLTKEILYTGITRARRLAVICGTEETLRAAIQRRIVRESGLLGS